MQKVEEIETHTMYKMIQALMKYDKYETRFLVQEFVKKRTNKDELIILEKLDRMLFNNEYDKVESFMNELVEKSNKLQIKGLQIIKNVVKYMKHKK